MAVTDSSAETDNANATSNWRVAMFGSLPPDRGISAYCLECATAIGRTAAVEFMGFRSLYPSLLYPGGGLRPDATFPPLDPAYVRARRRLTWYNPLTWLAEGLTCPGDLLHVQSWSVFQWPIQLAVMALFRLRGKACVLTLHNLSSHRARSRPFEFCLRTLTWFADSVIVHSPKLRETAIARLGLPAERVFSVPPGRFELFRDAGLSPASARQRLGLPADVPVVLLFGAIRGYKGVATLLTAMAEVRRSLPAARLLIAGKLWEPWEPYERQIKALGLDDGVDLHLDYVPTAEVKYYFTACDVVALPYQRFEAQSGVGMAALDFARPLVASDIGGLAELAPAGSILTPPGDAPALAQALLAVLQDAELWARLANGVQQAAGQYTWKANAEQTWQIYRQTMARRKR